MQVEKTFIDGVLVFEPKQFGDARGFFMESFNQRAFDDATGGGQAFVQDNHSRSAKGVLRGLHFQHAPHAQGKLVRVASGAVFDVVADIRPGSATFGRWFGLALSADNHRQLWIPPGLAHGFLVLTDTADFLYKTTAYYAPQAEGAVRWDDPDLAIAWPDVGMPPNCPPRTLPLAGCATWPESPAVPFGVVPMSSPAIAVQPVIMAGAAARGCGRCRARAFPSSSWCCRATAACSSRPRSACMAWRPVTSQSLRWSWWAMPSTVSSRWSNCVS